MEIFEAKQFMVNKKQIRTFSEILPSALRTRTVIKLRTVRTKYRRMIGNSTYRM